MSGSPVYIDGQLVGAVAYGLSWGPSPVAGVTPAADMQRLIDGGVQVRRAARDVTIPRRTADRLVADGTLTRAEADGGMTELATPLAVSGMGTAKRLKKATKRLGLSNVKVYRSGSAPAERVAPVDAGIVPGATWPPRCRTATSRRSAPAPSPWCAVRTSWASATRSTGRARRR